MRKRIAALWGGGCPATWSPKFARQSSSDRLVKYLEIATSLVENTKAVDSFQEHRIIVKMRTASIRTVEREQSSLYGEKLSPWGHTLVLIRGIFYHHTLPSKDMTVPFHDKAFRFNSWANHTQTYLIKLTEPQ